MSKTLSCRLGDEEEAYLEAFSHRYGINSSKVIKLLLMYVASTPLDGLDLFYRVRKDDLFKHGNTKK